MDEDDNSLTENATNAAPSVMEAARSVIRDYEAACFHSNAHRSWRTYRDGVALHGYELARSYIKVVEALESNRKAVIEECVQRLKLHWKSCMERGDKRGDDMAWGLDLGIKSIQAISAGAPVGEKPPSIVERFLVRRAKECLSTVAYAEANADDWAGALPAADRDRLRHEAQMYQLAADYLATQGIELHRLRSVGSSAPISAGSAWRTIESEGNNGK